MFIGFYRPLYRNFYASLLHSRKLTIKMLGEKQGNSGILSQKRPNARVDAKENRREEADMLNASTCSSDAVTPNRAPLSDIGSKANVSTTATSNISNSKTSHEKTRTIVVEGNIGSGKSTLLNYFSQKEGIEVLPEPVHKWRNNRGQNILDLFYKDPARWSFAFESYAQFTRLEVHEAKTNCRVKLMERSIYSGKYCFTENLFKSKFLQRPEYNVLCEWFDWLKTTKDLHIDHIVYLRSTPELCDRRIRERSRKEESEIPMDYLRDLHETHEDWLIRKTKFELPAPVIVLDATKPLEEMVNQFKYLEDKLNLKSI
ncbi:deoxynucleoside kinase-like [Acanthaster planci]|uniref:Deoxynucleoside kinase-like n=1 Tax=Acanthaster planci TaxID=133434 RepID=A0A8B7YPG1_ACAPL|nr:deoxynucleoside kinase-like [Acanthaster planci]